MVSFRRHILSGMAAATAGSGRYNRGSLVVLMLTLLLGWVAMTHARHLGPLEEDLDVNNNEIGGGGGVGGSVGYEEEKARQQETAEADAQKDWVKISQGPASIVNEVSQGDSFEFECEAVGSPAPSVQWLKDNTALLDTESFETNVISRSPSSGLAKVRARFFIPLVTKMHHEGSYTCVAESGSQIATMTTRLAVRDATRNLTQLLAHRQRNNGGRSAMHLRARIVLYDTIYMDNIGSDIVLPCKSIGVPRPSVMWLNPADNVIVEEEDEGRLRVEPDGRLRIRSIRWNDMGPYTCIVTNALGQDRITTFLYPMLAEK